MHGDYMQSYKQQRVKEDAVAKLPHLCKLSYIPFSSAIHAGRCEGGAGPAWLTSCVAELLCAPGKCSVASLALAHCSSATPYQLAVSPIRIP